MFNELLINPAYAGSHGNLSLNAQTRQQWVGLDGAPKTYTMTGHTLLKNKINGVGGTIVQDNIGESHTFSMMGSFTHRIFFKNTTLSMGIQGGFSNYRFELSNVNWSDDQTQEGLDADITSLLPNFGTGLFYNSHNYYVGLSVPHFVNNPFKRKDDTQKAQESRHYLLSGGYVYSINDWLEAKPNLLIKMVQGAPVQLDLNANFLIKEKYWIGFSWRSLESLDLLLEFNVSESLKVGYSYDFLTSGLRNVNTIGSHEIMISYEFLGWDETFDGDKEYHPRYF